MSAALPHKSKARKPGKGVWGAFSLLSQPSSHATMEQGPEGWFSSPTKPASSTQTPRPPLKKKKERKKPSTIPTDCSKQEALFSSLENRKCLQRSGTFLVAAPYIRGLWPQPAAADNLEAEPPQPPAPGPESVRSLVSLMRSLLSRIVSDYHPCSTYWMFARGCRNAAQNRLVSSWLHRN